MRLARVLSGLSVAAAMALAQYPGQYPPGGQSPPGQYPQGGQYPPGQYPPGEYPPNSGGGYPNSRFPFPVPEMKLPKRGDKDKKAESEMKMSLASVDGSLRRLREKDLILQT